MKKFRTDFEVGVSGCRIGLGDPVMTVGSCFAENVGGHLKGLKFMMMNNPAGTVYHPLAIHKTLDYFIHNTAPDESTYLENQSLWSNYDFHSSFSGSDKVTVQRNISNTIQSSHDFLQESKILIITYGTSWVYERIDSGELVANCHKVPAALFRKRLLTVSEIINSFEALKTSLQVFKPDLKIILTLSPVRHVKDTMELNSVSKSILRLAIHQIIEKYTDVNYFPAYEIMMDDLRDYRFYGADMLHPSDEAVGYILEKFAHRYFDQTTQAFIQHWQRIATSLEHIPFHASSAAHQKFLSTTLKQLEELKNTVDVEEEINLIKRRLSHL